MCKFEYVLRYICFKVLRNLVSSFWTHKLFNEKLQNELFSDYINFNVYMTACAYIFTKTT